MLKIRGRFCALMLAGIVFLLPIMNAVGEHETISSDAYITEYIALAEGGASETELISALEKGLELYPAEEYFRYNLLVAYSRLGEKEKAKNCAKEALQYDPESMYYAHFYMAYCDFRITPDEALKAAEYVLELGQPQLPPVGKVVSYDNCDINSYNSLMYCMDAQVILMQIYAERNDEGKVLQCGRWILQRKDDSEYGYQYGLYTMLYFVTYYGHTKRFDQMKDWLDQYFVFEESADTKGEAYKQIRIAYQQSTGILKKIFDEYMTKGDDIDIASIINEKLKE